MKNRSTILLDLDGVMIKNKSWEPVKLLDDGFCAFDETATRNLNRLISETNARIVLTTTHKVKYNVSEWNDIFK
jgi:recombinational DNA repair ATPase RecF